MPAISSSEPFQSSPFSPVAVSFLSFSISFPFLPHVGRPGRRDRDVMLPRRRTSIARAAVGCPRADRLWRPHTVHESEVIVPAAMVFAQQNGDLIGLQETEVTETRCTVLVPITIGAVIW
ncbi:hypothetical protein ACP70R_019170 [Stipagrostis hirtigluma subsp. patula]